MTTRSTKLEGRTFDLDGEPLVVWTESDPDEFSVVARDHDGHEVGYARAIRNRDGPTATLALRTSHTYRRRGLGRELLGTMLQWAQQAHVEYLVGTVPASDSAVRPFLAGSGRPVATRTNGRTAKYSIAVPRGPSPDDEIRDEVANALAGGASFAEAEALRRRRLAATRAIRAA